MNRLKLNLFILASILTIGFTIAKTGNDHAIIRQSGDHKIILTAKAELDHPLTVEFTNKKGEIIFSDKIEGNRIVKKTYDLSETKVGQYNVSLYCNDKSFASTYISEGMVELANNHKIHIQ